MHLKSSPHSTLGYNQLNRAQSFEKFSAWTVFASALLMLAALVAGFNVQLPLIPPWSCVAFLLIGSILLTRGQLWRISIFVLVIGLVAWGEFVFNVDTGFDRLLFPSLIVKDLPHPGRPAPLAAFQFLLTGTALLLLPARRRAVVLAREVCAVTSIILCYLASVGYLRTGVNPQETTSPLAAALFFLSSIDVLLLGEEGVLLPLLRDAGPAGIFARRLMPVPLILPVATALVRVGLERVGVIHGPVGLALFGAVDVLTAIVIVWASSGRVLKLDRLHRQAEDQLRQQQANAVLGSVMEACPFAICAFYLDGGLRRYNRTAEGVLVPLSPECRDLVDRAAHGDIVAGAPVILLENGKEHHFEVWTSQIPAPDGGVDGVVIMAADVSGRKALEAQMQQAQRLESLGVLAGGIAHDFNNLLTGVMGHASLLQEQLPRHSRSADSVRALLDAADRMAKLTQQMLAYSGKGRFVIERIDLSAQVGQIVNLILASIPKNAELRLSLNESLPVIEADGGQLQQVIMNLIINAAEALGSAQGTVTVETYVQPMDHDALSANVTRQAVPAGNYVTLEVRDNGLGMDEQTRSRIFDPFFTTKFAGRGLGLSAVLGIVRAHFGALTVDSRPGEGTTFRVYFPAAGKTVSAAVRGAGSAQLS